MKIPEIRFEPLDAVRWRIPRNGPMRVDGIIYADEKGMEAIRSDQSPQQVANVACLPGIVGASLAMPDMHWGYGFPIGGVAAFDPDEGVVSPGGVGYDINCGVRLLRSNLEADALAPRMKDLVNALFRAVPTGIGAQRRELRLDRQKLRRVLRDGAKEAVASGFGDAADLDHIEEGGTIAGADPDQVSDRAIERGSPQLGTLGSGNHFLEVQRVAEIYEPEAAAAFGLRAGQAVFMIRTGSRGLGHQVCDDFIQVMIRAASRYGIELPDRQLCCAPLKSDEARRYLGAMASAANFAFSNRQVIAHFLREALERDLGIPPREHRLSVVYDVCHNIAKTETHEVDGRARKLCVHRKGATRAFPPGHPQTPAAYRAVGQPVIIPGDMGRYSFVLAGTERAFRDTWGSSCHGAGRRLSRTEAKRLARGRPIVREMEDRGIIVRSAGMATLLEEVPEAYKDVADVVGVVERAGISRRVARLIPMGVIKG